MENLKKKLLGLNPKETVTVGLLLSLLSGTKEPKQKTEKSK
jgi:hypothetical protein